MLPVGYLPCTQDPPEGRNMARVLDEIMAEAQAAEASGWDGCFITEHHQQPDGYLPNPLLVAGLLIASGGLNPYAFIPLSLVACIAGSLVGYSWARAVGDRGLMGLARRLRQQRNLERAEERLRAAGWRGIAISRLIPGLRIYTTLNVSMQRAANLAVRDGLHAYDHRHGWRGNLPAHETPPCAPLFAMLSGHHCPSGCAA